MRWRWLERERRLVAQFSWVTLIWRGWRCPGKITFTVPGQVNFYGSTLVGIPAFRAGFNDRLGYVQTNNGPDLQDIYALPLAEERADVFLQNGRPRDIERRRIIIDVERPDGSFAVQERDYEHTSLGPVIYRTDDRVFVVRSVNVEWWRQYEGFFELMHADSLNDFRRILGRGLAVTSNYTYADAQGNILLPVECPVAAPAQCRR